LLAVALRHQHVDFLRAQRVQSLMQVYGSGQSQIAPLVGDSRLIDLDSSLRRIKAPKSTLHERVDADCNCHLGPVAAPVMRGYDRRDSLEFTTHHCMPTLSV
jgi:hypothetical protein